MRLVSWNVNSIRARADRVLDWLALNDADVALLQETRCSDQQLASNGFADRLAAMGYALAHHGGNHWNGVAIASRVGLEAVERGFPGPNRPPFDEARIMSATCGGLRVWSIYAPNGRELDDPHYLFKLVWFERLRAALGAEADGPPLVVAGDFNVAPADADIYDPSRWRRRTHASPPERAALAALVDLGLCDVTRAHLPDPGVYTWWSHRPGQFAANRGLRIDLALCSGPAARRVHKVWVDTAERGRPGSSDHAPLVIEIDA